MLGSEYTLTYVSLFFNFILLTDKKNVSYFISSNETKVYDGDRIYYDKNR